MPLEAVRQYRWAFSVNDSGTATGWGDVIDAAGQVRNRSLRWSHPHVPDVLVSPPGHEFPGSTYGQAINNAGVIVGQAEVLNATGQRLRIAVVRWNPNETIAEELVDLKGGYSHAYDVNESGAIAGFSSKAENGQYKGYWAVRWDAGSALPTQLGSLSPTRTNSYAYGINDAGDVVGISELSVGFRGAYWPANQTVPVELKPPNFDISKTGVRPAAINNAGQVVGSIWNDHPHAMRWNSPTEVGEFLREISTPSITTISSKAMDISEDGEIVGTISARNYAHAVLWSAANEVWDLNELIAPNSGWTLEEATGISANGWIVGSGVYKGIGMGFVLQPVPEPTIAVRLLVLWTLMCRWRRPQSRK